MYKKSERFLFYVLLGLIFSLIVSKILDVDTFTLAIAWFIGVCNGFIIIYMMDRMK